MGFRSEKSVDRRMRWMDKLERENPERFCWAALVMYAYHGEFGDLQDTEPNFMCELDCKESGSCWCGKFKLGENGQMVLNEER